VHPGDNLLHRARVRRGIDLSQLAARTLLSPRIVHSIDEGRLAELPGGLYARSYIRTFASAVGLDPEETVLALADCLPPAQDPFPVMREIARAGDPPWVVAVEDAGASARKWWTRIAVALTMTRTAGATMDAVILLIIQAALIGATAWLCGVSVEALLEFGSGPLAAVWGTVVLAYFLIVGGVRRAPRRALVCRLPDAACRPARFDLPTILGRALFH
jgi:hypothetical protein